MARFPNINERPWGATLLEWLRVSHNDDGTIKGIVQQILPSFPLAGLPPAGTAGRLARVTDDNRGLRTDTGTIWSAKGRTFYAEDFDISPDRTAAQNDTGIAALLAALPVGGSSIVFPPGTINYNTGFTLGVGQSLFGQGMNATVLRYGGAGVGITITGTNARSLLQGFRLTTTTSSPSLGPGTHGIRLKNTTIVTLRDIEVRGFSVAGVHLNAEVGEIALNILMDGIFVHENQDGVLAAGANTVMNHVTITGSNVRAQVGYNIFSSQDLRNWTLLGNNFEAATPYALYLNNVKGLIIHGNYFEQAGSNGAIRLSEAAGTDGPMGVSIKGNHFSGGGSAAGGTGILLGTSSFVFGVEISGNWFNSWQTAINANAVQRGVIGPNWYTTNGTDLVVSGLSNSDQHSLILQERAFVSPAQLIADQNNYDPDRLARTWRLSSDAARTITGIASGWHGRRLTIANVGAQNILLANENVGSLAASRIITGTGASITLVADDTADLIYDATTGRWRVTNTH